MAQTLGLFEKHGLNVSLHRELGWATIRDKIIYGQLDAAHALAAMPLATTLGLGSIACDCLTALVLNLNGNAITLSEDLWKRGVRDGATLREEVMRCRHQKVFTFGVVHRFSSHLHLLGAWLRGHGIEPHRDVHLVVLPPSQMVSHLASGNLDGFCVGEPWNSVAIRAGTGWCVETSVNIDPGHPEKVLMVRKDFAERRESEHLRLVAALIEACEFCDDPRNAESIAETLSRPEYIRAPVAALLAGTRGPFALGHGVEKTISDFSVFHRDGANEPTAARAAWVLDLVRASGACKELSALNQTLGSRLYRNDLFERALEFGFSRSPKTNEKENELCLEMA
jgi:ABC-type nitrate/sulfonate/bicarbonate transport system substrate-binding protein